MVRCEAWTVNEACSVRSSFFVSMVKIRDYVLVVFITYKNNKRYYFRIVVFANFSNNINSIIIIFHMLTVSEKEVVSTILE